MKPEVHGETCGKAPADRRLGRHAVRLACIILGGAFTFVLHCWWYPTADQQGGVIQNALDAVADVTVQVRGSTSEEVGLDSKHQSPLAPLANRASEIFDKYAAPPWGATPVSELRRRPANGQCASNSREPSIPTTIYDLIRAPQLNASQFLEVLKVQFDESTWTYSDGADAITSKLKKRDFFGSRCPAKCQVVKTNGEAYVFNQFTTDFKKKVRNGTISVVYSGEILGGMWRKNVVKGVSLRMSSSMLADESDISMPWGCAFVTEYCAKNKCPPDFARDISRRPLLAGNEKAKSLVASIISNGVKPRSEVLRNLMHRLSSNGQPGTENYGSLLLNRKSSALSGRGGYADGSKINIFRSYPFAFVPENSWSHVKGSGYVTEKAYDAYMAGSLPIWEGTLNSSNLHLYFPVALKRKQTMLRIKDYADWKNATALAEHIRYLASHPEAYAEYFDWDINWFRSGPLRRACEERRWCKLCVALHVMQQGFCPPFL